MTNNNFGKCQKCGAKFMASNEERDFGCGMCGYKELNTTNTHLGQPVIYPCFCQSYVDDNNELQDCTCGKCEVTHKCEDCQGEMCEEHGTHNGHPIGNCFVCKDGL